jgi:hypothetical protein
LGIRERITGRFNTFSSKLVINHPVSFAATPPKRGTVLSGAQKFKSASFPLRGHPSKEGNKVNLCAYIQGG